MALQDLTPQLRTRLNRMERAVGWFVFVATALLVFGFGYYIYKTAENKGWFKIRALYYTYADSGDGLNVGDEIKLMGFTAGHITRITATRPWSGEPNVYIEFVVLEPYYGYLWTEGSSAEVKDAGFLGKRELNLTKGTGGRATYLNNLYRNDLSLAEARSLPKPENWRLAEDVYSGTNLVVKAWQKLSPGLLDQLAGLQKNTIRAVNTEVSRRSITAYWSAETHGFEPFKAGKPFLLPQDESPALAERAKRLLTEIEAALPNFLALTNQISATLSNTTALASNANVVALSAQPTISNLAIISSNLREPNGSLGNWLIPTNLQAQLSATLLNANTTITNADTNLMAVAEQITKSLENLANITSNLNAQVQANSNIVSQVSDIIVHADEFVQGLKHHWLLRSAFKEKSTNAPSAQPSGASLSPRAREQRR